MQINEMLSQLHTILKCNIALLSNGNLYFFPDVEVIALTGQELQGYKAWNVGGPEDKSVFYIDSSAEISEESLALTILFLQNHLSSKFNMDSSFTRLLSGNFSYSDIMAANQLFTKERSLFLIAIGGVDLDSIQSELLEIVQNSVTIKYITEYQGNLVALVEEKDILEACSNLQKNILTELFVEAAIAIGGNIEQPQQLTEGYNNCMEAMLLKRIYGLNQNLLDFHGMLLYRLISSVDQNAKDDMLRRIFNSRFTELLDGEMELTIEEMFKNNLNLTDTSVRLYIHRNTLLYRIEKIYKLTGFDLRKFEDSMIFKLAWLMHKEKRI